MSEKIIEMRSIRKSFYIDEPNELEILHGIDLDVYKGEFVSIVGASGSGKSTLMNIIGVLDRATSGHYMLNGLNIDEADDGDLSAIRNRSIGFVFQNFNLIPRTSALMNVELPMMYAGVSKRARSARAKELLELVEMSERAKHLPNELSGGQKQRVSIARAMANDPAIILADEPTGALDSKTSRDILVLLEKINKQYGTTMLIVTHNNSIKQMVDHVIYLKDGEIHKDYYNETKVQAAELEDL